MTCRSREVRFFVYFSLPVLLMKQTIFFLFPVAIKVRVNDVSNPRV